MEVQNPADTSCRMCDKPLIEKIDYWNDDGEGTCENCLAAWEADQLGRRD